MKADTDEMEKLKKGQSTRISRAAIPHSNNMDLVPLPNLSALWMKKLQPGCLSTFIHLKDMAQFARKTDPQVNVRTRDSSRDTLKVVTKGCAVSSKDLLDPGSCSADT